MKLALNIIISLVILTAGYFGWHHIIEHPSDKDEPELTREQRREMMRERSQQTRILELTPHDFPITLETQGIVRPSLVTSITSRVSGRVTDQIPKPFNDGAFVKKGDPLLYLDTTDFKSEIITAEANVARAASALEQEKARATQALRNWKDIGFNEEPNDLVLRVPQLKEAEANLAAQTEALAKATRNLEHAVIRAPFDGRIRSRLVGPGQSIGTGTSLGEIFATATAEVRLPLSTRQLSQINIDEQQLANIKLSLSDALQPDNTTRWNADIVRIEGELDETSRELFVIAIIPDPFGLNNKQPPLRINQPVKAHIVGNTLKNVVAIPRDALHGADEVILIEDLKIKRAKINIIWTTLDTVIADNPELHNSTLALSKLPYAPEGSPIRILEEAPKTEESNSPAVKKETTKTSHS